MIPWVHNFTDLRGIGVDVSDEQQHVLEHGGEVLAIQRLPAIQDCGCGDDHGLCMVDQEGKPMMLPFVYNAVDPLSSYEPTWKAGGLTCAEHLEGQDPGWRLFPSYVGSNHTTVMDYWYDDELRFVRAWQGIPLLTRHDQELAQVLIAGFRSLLNDSVYEEMQHLNHIESEVGNGAGDFDLEDPDDEVGHQYWTLRKMLSERGYIIEIGDGFWQDGYPIDFDPVEQHVLNPEARQLWRRLVRQSQSAAFSVLEAIPLQQRAGFVYNEKDVEPWF